VGNIKLIPQEECGLNQKMLINKAVGQAIMAFCLSNGKSSFQQNIHHNYEQYLLISLKTSESSYCRSPPQERSLQLKGTANPMATNIRIDSALIICQSVLEKVITPNFN
jgi:hypothetical protein